MLHIQISSELESLQLLVLQAAYHCAGHELKTFCNNYAAKPSSSGCLAPGSAKLSLTLRGEHSGLCTEDNLESKMVNTN